MKINGNNNFIRIFQIPKCYPSGYCFGGGKPVVFLMVDWFNPYPVMGVPIDIKVDSDSEEINNKVNQLKPLCECKNGELELNSEIREKLNNMLKEFILKKSYAKEGYDLLAITNYGDSFVIPTNIKQ